MSFFRIVWAWICVLITFLAGNVYFIIIIFVQWMLKTFSWLVRWTFSISAMAVATEAAASSLTTQQANWNRETSLLLMCRLGHTHSSHLACQPSTEGIWMSITTVVGYPRMDTEGHQNSLGSPRFSYGFLSLFIYLVYVAAMWMLRNQA